MLSRERSGNDFRLIVTFSRVGQKDLSRELRKIESLVNAGISPNAAYFLFFPLGTPASRRRQPHKYKSHPLKTADCTSASDEKNVRVFFANNETLRSSTPCYN